MTAAPTMLATAKPPNAAGIGSSAWLERPARILNKIKASGLLKIVSLSSLQETAFLTYSNHRRASNPTKKKLNMKIELTYNYFTATLTGYNGSRGTVLAEASGCWKTESEADAALNDAIRSEAESILDGNGYGWSEHDEAELRDMLSNKLDRELQSLDEGETGELESAVKAAAAKYGDKIPVSCGAMGLEFGDAAESEDDLIDWAISHDHQRLITSYRVTPSYDGRLIHDLEEELAPGDLPSWDANPENVIEVLSRRYELPEDAEVEVVNE